MIQVNSDPEFTELWAVKVIFICYLFSLLISWATGALPRDLCKLSYTHNI